MTAKNLRGPDELFNGVISAVDKARRDVLETRGGPVWEDTQRRRHDAFMDAVREATGPLIKKAFTESSADAQRDGALRAYSKLWILLDDLLSGRAHVSDARVAEWVYCDQPALVWNGLDELGIAPVPQQSLVEAYSRNDPKGWGGDPSRGAALGRKEVTKGDSFNFDGTLTLVQVTLNDDGYDFLGTYHGVGETLWWYIGGPGFYEGYHRGSYDGAASMLKARFPKARVVLAAQKL